MKPMMKTNDNKERIKCNQILSVAVLIVFFWTVSEWSVHTLKNALNQEVEMQELIENKLKLTT